MQSEPECYLESFDSCRHVLDAYDAASDRLVFGAEGRFWKSIQHIHELGKRGASRRIAIIDSACDMRHPRLKRVIDHVAENLVPPTAGDSNLEHGTAVALLISEVAPDSRIDIYPVVREDGKPDVYAVRDAIHAAAESDAHILNLSLGLQRPLDKPPEFPLENLSPEEKMKVVLEPKAWLASRQPDDPACFLCPAAAEAAGKGKLVFASAGNAADFIYCPARCTGVIGVGFQNMQIRQVKTADGIGADTALQEFPVRQSGWLDMVVDGIDGVLGTSFASPLRAAAAAILEIMPQQYQDYSHCFRLAWWFWFYHLNWTLSPSVPSWFDKELGAICEAALKSLPHVHCEAIARLRPDLSPTDPSGCALCGHMFGDLYLNSGLFALEQRNFPVAESLLQAARKLAPWMGEAAANLGATFKAQGKLNDALKLYDEALALRPATQIYLDARKAILDEIAKKAVVTRTAADRAQSILSVRPDPIFSQFSSGSWMQVTASSRAKEEFLQKLGGLTPGWAMHWEPDRVVACKQQAETAQAASSSALLCVSCDGKTITANASPETDQALREVADFMAAVAGLLNWTMVKVKGGDKFLRIYQMCQLLRGIQQKK